MVTGFEYFAAAVELNRRSRNTKHTNANLSNSNPPRVIQSLRGRLRLVVSLDLLPGRSLSGLSLVSLWDERAVPFALRQKAPLVRLPTRACPRRPAQVFLGRHRFYFVSTSFECPPHTETSATSERNLETKFSKRVADTTDHLGL